MVMPAATILLRLTALIAAYAALLGASGAGAACLLGMVEAPGRVILAAAHGPDPVAAGNVRVSYLGHSSFLIETPGGASAITDYNGINVAAFVPDIVTMNNSHETHYTETPDPAIRHVLRGWQPGGGMARHEVRVRDLRTFNVPTNIGEYGDPGSNGNSIFVFEIANLCIAHLGHLHHELTREQLLRLGRIDVLFVPIDGSSTIAHPQAIRVIEQISPRLVIPMHFGFFGAADTFFELAKQRWTIRSEKGGTLLVNRAMLPKSTEIRFLQAGAF